MRWSDRIETCAHGHAGRVVHSSATIVQLNVERMSNRVDGLAARTDALEKLYGAQLLWKVDNYQQKFNEAKAGSRPTIFSPPFLTGRHGYKMALSACLFGDGKGGRNGTIE